MLKRCVFVFCLVAGVATSLTATAQNAPGTDPIQLDTRVTLQGMPYGSAPRSGNISPPAEIPAWQRAKIARYEAKAFSGNVGNIQTEKDVVNTANSDGFKTTCTQSIGSSVAPTGITTGAGFMPKDQIVVLRGDLVNICN